MYEIEGQLHANRIWVDDFSGVREYQFTGGAAFKQVSKCFELFKLEVKLEDCTQRQVFGCTPDCTSSTNFDGSNIIFAIPLGYMGNGFYNSNKQLIAYDYDGLLDYFRTRTGTTDVNDVDTEEMECTAYKVLSVTSTADIDTHIYFDAPASANKVHGVVVTGINDLCAYLPQVCIVPVQGIWAVEEPV